MTVKDTPRGREIERTAGETEAVYELEARHVREFKLTLNGVGPVVTIKRTPRPDRIAVREIILPLDRPVVLKVEEFDDLEPESQRELSRLFARGSGELHPDSLLVPGIGQWSGLI